MVYRSKRHMVIMKKYIKFLLVIAVCAAMQSVFVVPAKAAIVRTHAYLQTGSSANINQTILSSVNTANSTLIVITVRSYMGGTAPVLVNSITGTLTAALTIDGVAGSGVRERIYYMWGSSVGSATHSFTSTTTGGGYNSIHVVTYTGTLTTSDPIDQTATGTSVGGSATATISPTQDNELFYSVVCGNSNNVAPSAAGSPMTLINSQGFISGGSFLGADADYIQTTAASVTASFTYVATNSVIAFISFKSEPSGDSNSGFW